MATKKMISSSIGHIHFKFKNGYEISILHGAGAYADGELRDDDGKPCRLHAAYCVSSNCEVAIFHNNEWATKEILGTSDDVKGYVSIDELCSIIESVRRLK